MLLAYHKEIIQNQRKTVRRTITINVWWRKSSCEFFLWPPLTHRAPTRGGGGGAMPRGGTFRGGGTFGENKE